MGHVAGSPQPPLRIWPHSPGPASAFLSASAATFLAPGSFNFNNVEAFDLSLPMPWLFPLASALAIYCSSNFVQKHRVGIKEGTKCLALACAIDSIIPQDSHATRHYQNLVVELETLGSTLQRVNQIEPTKHELVHLDAIRASAAACRRPLANFLERLEKFESALSPWNAKEYRAKGLGRKIEYGLTIESDVQELRTTLTVHASAINMLLLAQTLLSITAAEVGQAEIASTSSNSTILLSQVKDGQDETSQELQAMKKAFSALQTAVNQFKDAEKLARKEHRETNAALKAQKETLDALKSSVDNSTSSVAMSRSIFLMRQGGDSFKTAGPTYGEASDIQANFERLQRELKTQYPYGAISGAIQAKEKTQTSFLENTSKVLNLVLSGVIAAGMWTIMNQSQEIAQISRLLIDNCTAPSRGPLHGVPQSSGCSTQSECSELNIPTTIPVPKSPEEIKRNLLKRPKTHRRSTTFLAVVGTIDFDREIENLSGSFDTGKAHFGPQVYFQWTEGRIIETTPAYAARGQYEHAGVHSVASLFRYTWSTGISEREVVRIMDRNIKGGFSHSNRPLSEGKTQTEKKWSRRIKTAQSPWDHPSSNRYLTSIDQVKSEDSPAVLRPQDVPAELASDSYGVDVAGPIYESKSAGLIGRLPLLLGLAAVTAPKGRVAEILTRCIQPDGWKPHGLAPEREDRHHGVIITILYDPANPEFSTKERLECLEEWRDGPFFGPEKHTSDHILMQSSFDQQC